MESTLPKFFCFTLMPFDDSFNDIYKYGIKESCKEVDSYCERVDEQIFDGSILNRIYNQISKADLIIADMTTRNPNVFYEVGYAHALNKPTILLTQNPDDIPFDLKHYPHIIYDGKIDIIRDELPRRIDWFKKNKNLDKPEFIFGFEIFVEKKNLLKEKVIKTFPIDYWPDFEFSIHNSSNMTYKSEDFQMGFICEHYDNTSRVDIETTQLPDGRFMHMIPTYDNFMLPGTYKTYSISLNVSKSKPPHPNDFKIIIRVFTLYGYRDFEFEMNGTEN